MASEKQIEANRRNSEKSTGPKTDEGKSIVSKNSVKHGLLASETLLPWEDAKNLEDLENRLLAALHPQGELEHILADRIVSLTWRLCRAGKLESALFVWKKYSEQFKRAKIEYDSTVRFKDPMDISFPPTKVIEDEDKHQAAYEKLCEESTLVNSSLPTFGRLFSEGAEPLALLLRYEMGIEKSLFKALHELQRLQAFRTGKDAQVPVAIDIHGEGNESVP